MSAPKPGILTHRPGAPRTLNTQEAPVELQILPITSANRHQAEALEVRPDQAGFIEPVAQCLAEADRLRLWRPVGLYAAGALVGFSMYGLFWMEPPLGRLWLDRLLIDRRFQGRGYGRAALALLLARLHREYRRKNVYLSVYSDNRPAIALYRSAGFLFTGRHDLHGEAVMVYTYPDRRGQLL